MHGDVLSEKKVFLEGFPKMFSKELSQKYFTHYSQKNGDEPGTEDLVSNPIPEMN